jgi:hypothetical protein
MVAALLWQAALPFPAGAQALTAPDLKAAFLATFPKFTEWPDASGASGPLSFCVLDDKIMAAALQAILAAHGEQPRPSSVRIVKLDPSIRSCHLLYVGTLDPKQSAQLFETVKGAPVFTVGDGATFAASGGIAQFRVDRGRVRFAINVAAARRARLVLSSRLLSLATLVKDADNAER